MELIVPVAGGEIWAEDSEGDGTPLVLVHPDWGNADIWSPLADILRDLFRVIRYDDRGFGRCAAPPVSFSRPGDLRAVLDHVGVKNAVIAGHSGGGGTAAARSQITSAVSTFLAAGDLEVPPPPAYSRLAAVRAPTVVVRGDREYPMVAECSDQIAARIPGSRRIVVPGADHLLPLRVPGRLAEIIIEHAG